MQYDMYAYSLDSGMVHQALEKVSLAPAVWDMLQAYRDPLCCFAFGILGLGLGLVLSFTGLGFGVWSLGCGVWCVGCMV